MPSWGMDFEELERSALRANQQMADGRRVLVSAVRSTQRAGMSEYTIARAVGRSQAEVNRLSRFHSSSPTGRRLRQTRSQVGELLAQAELKDPRVFGSVARGDDSEDSDVDLLVATSRSVGLFEQARLAERLSGIVGTPVDLVIEGSLKPELAERILEEAVPL